VGKRQDYCKNEKSMVKSMIIRENIIVKLRKALGPPPYIYAFWLEGADAIGTEEEYSDIDFHVDFENEYEKQTYEAV
jgi:hypothetical protein